MANWLTDAWFYVATGKTASTIEAETAANNAILDARNADLLQRGVWTTEDREDSDQQRQAEDYWRAPGSDVGQAALDGAADGFNAVATGVAKTANAVAGTAGRFVWRAVPWWLWLLCAGWLAWQLGFVKKGLGFK